MTTYQGSSNLSASGSLIVRETPPQTINTPAKVFATPEVDFTTSPIGTPFTYVIGGTTFVTDEAVTPINQAVTFTAISRYPEGKYAVKYHWSFGDGHEGWGSVVTHTYTVPNSHVRSTLTVIDNFGNRTYAAHQIYLKDLNILNVGLPLTLESDSPPLPELYPLTGLYPENNLYPE